MTTDDFAMSSRRGGRSYLRGMKDLLEAMNTGFVQKWLDRAERVEQHSLAQGFVIVLGMAPPLIVRAEVQENGLSR